jgi:hypothetical protein
MVRSSCRIQMTSAGFVTGKDTPVERRGLFAVSLRLAIGKTLLGTAKRLLGIEHQDITDVVDGIGGQARAPE